MDLNLLVAFEALYRERSVTRAGRRLGLSQPATSAALARLRQSFGDPLFTSTPRGLEPTARCLALAGPVGAALEGLRAALSQEDAFDPATTTADLRLGAVDAVMAAVLHGVAARVLSEAPRARLRLTSIDPRTAANLLDEGSIDLAVAPALDPPAHLQVRPLFPLSFVVACRPGHPLPRRPKLRDLARYPHVDFLVRRSAAHRRGRRLRAGGPAASRGCRGELVPRGSPGAGRKRRGGDSPRALRTHAGRGGPGSLRAAAARSHHARDGDDDALVVAHDRFAGRALAARAGGRCRARSISCGVTVSQLTAP